MRRDQRSAQAAEYRRWYKLSRWLRLRDATLLRDGFTCRMCGRLRRSTELTCDHIAPHRGDEAKFFDPDNLQTLCTWPCHIRHKQGEERGGKVKVSVGLDGWPV